MDYAGSFPRTPAFAGILEALEKLRSVVPETPLIEVKVGSGQIWCKAESLQPVGAFKLRGAWHRLTALNDAQRRAGVVAFSSGNHAQGVAWSAQRLGIAAAIVMPADAPTLKIEGTRSLGAEIVLYDRATGSREAIAAALASERGATLVPSFDDPWIIEGQGTAGLEAVAQMGTAPDLIVTPCGGGGLAAGLALAVPEARMIVVEPPGWDDMTRSLAQGRIVPVAQDAPPTACDALMTKRVAASTFDILRARSATGCAVSDEEVGAAMHFARTKMSLTLEPGGAAALAAILSGKAQPGVRTLVILSGGNVDPGLFTRMTGL
jgi:threonine dehydratase